MRLRVIHCLLLLPLIALAARPTHAQQKDGITGRFSGAFETIAQQIEASTDYHIYYKPEWVDTLTFDVQVTDQPITELFSKLLAGTQLRFALDVNKNIYVTYDREILTQLPPGLFPDEDKSKGEKKSTFFDYSEYEKREKKKKTAEEKVYYIGNDTGNMQGTATIAGNVVDMDSGEPIIGASVYIANPLIGATTDQFGYYSLTIPKGRHEILVKSVGMKATKRQVMLYASGKLAIELEEDVTPLKEVTVVSDRDARVAGLQMGMEKLDIKTMKQMPLALGETDIMKVILTLPGVQTVGEGTVGLNVRGGATNQNLILYNDAIVYNPSHMFGFFSTFNPDVLKNVELYKSGITADYGGRLSSVLDVHTREGNLKKITGSGGLSPVTGRFTIEGPIVKERTSFIIGLRSSYSNWLLRKVDYDEIKNSSASFYDINLGVSHKINDKNNLYLSGYFSKDKFALNSDTAYNYSDRNGSLKWKHIFNNKIFGVLTTGFSQYSYDMRSNENPVEAFTMAFNIRQLNAKADFTYFLTEKHTLTAGLSTIRYNLDPGTFKPYGEASIYTSDKLQKEQGQETAAYLGENFDVSPNLSLYGGVRFSLYQTLGPKDVYTYAPGVPRQPSTLQDTVHYGKGSIANYQGAEPRFSIRYLLSKNTSVKASYNRMRQYIQMLSNTTAITPTDNWKLSDSYIKPQVGDQYSAGIYKNFKNNQIETSVEGYYKITESTIDYKDGAELLRNHHLETDVLAARGKAYGVELLVKKASGKVNGWISYTYSRSFLQTKSDYKSESVNNGKYYPASYDKPHAVNFIGNYKFSRRFNFSLNVVYSTGRPITVPLVKYDVGGSERIYYSDRNQSRIPDYFRTDISLNLEGNHKIKKLAHYSWTFSVYNLTGRHNAYSVFFASQAGQIKGYQMSIFAQPIPTLTYNFKF
jgi:hypothetical protein